MNNIITNRENDILVIEFCSDSILDSVQIESIGGELYTIADRSAFSRIIVDLENVEFMSSALIGVFIKFNMRVRKNESELKLCNASEDLINVLKVTKLDNVFDIHTTRRAAIESFQATTG